MADKTNLATIVVNSVEVPPLVINGIRVMTLAMIDKVHGRTEGTAKRNFSENKSRLTDGEDYFLVKNSQKNEFRTFGIEVPNRGLMVVTESGYLLLVKSFTDDLAWQVQKQLVKAYFKAGSPAEIPAPFELTSDVHAKTLIPSEQQTLSEIVHNKAAPYGENAGKALAEIWSRLHRKFRVSKYSQLDRTLLSNAIVYVSGMTLRGAAPDALPSPANDKLQLGFDKSEEGAALAQLAMHSMVGKDFLLRVCAMPDGRAFHSVQPILDSAFLISMRDIPQLLAESGLVAVKKSALDALALLAA